jgi:hypothetical protein
MKTQKDQTTKIILSVIIIIIILKILLVLSNKIEIFSVEVYDKNGVMQYKETFNQAKSVEISQSFFDNPDYFKMSLTAEVPSNKVDQYMIFKANVPNPFNEMAQILNIKIYKNGNEISSEDLSFHSFASGESYRYKSAPIDMIGKDAQRNELLIKFKVQNKKGEIKEVEFIYEYLSLTKCMGNSNCKSPNTECDINNLARLSIDKERYCAKPCNGNIECPDGQLCIVGLCGY